MSLAKTAPVQQPSISVQPIVQDHTIKSVVWEGVPIDIMRFFDIEFLHNKNEGEMKKLRDIADWTFQGSETLGDGMKKLRDLEIKLGTPNHETRQNKIWTWIKFQKQIEDLHKRQEAVSHV
jgi:hypothetical protein